MLAVQYLCRCFSFRHHAFYVCMNTCISQLQLSNATTQETFPPPLYLHKHHAGRAPPSLTFPSHLPHPLIHLPPLCSVSPSHNPPCAIITRSTSPLQLPWQQQCWAQVPVLPASATDHYHLLHQNKVNQSFLHDLWTPRGRLCG